MLVSIIVPAYNVENYIKDCLDSLLKQTYKKIEIIIINDGSTDKTCEVIMSYNFQTVKHKIINISNSGVSTARNIGIEHAEGKYLYFLDSDDWVDETFIENLVLEAERYQSDICFGGWIVLNEKLEKQLDYKSSGLRYFNGVKTGIEALKLKMKKEIWISPGTFILNRDFINVNKLRFVDGYAYGEDIHFINNSILKAKVVTCIDQDGFINRVRSGSATTSAFNEKFFDSVYLSKEFYTQISQSNELCQSDKIYLLDLIKNDYNNLLIGVYRRMVVGMSLTEFKSILKKIDLELFPLKSRFYLRIINKAWKLRYYSFRISKSVGYYVLKLEGLFKGRG